MPPLTDFMVPSAWTSALVRFGDVVGDVGGQRGLAHAGTSGDDDQVGPLQAAHLGVEIAQAGGDAGQFSVALIGVGRHVERGLHRLREALEAAVVAAGLGQFVELAFGILDLRARRKIHRRVEGDVDHVLADPDQIAAQRHVVDRPAVILRVDDGGGFGRDAGEVLADRHAADIGLGGQEGFQRDGGRNLAHPDQAAGGLVDRLMDRFEEVFRLEEVRNPVERVVVDQDRAQQALFRFDIVRRTPIGRSSRVGGELQDVRISQGHGRDYSSDLVVIGIPGCGAAIKRQPRAERKCEACLMHRFTQCEM